MSQPDDVSRAAAIDWREACRSQERDRGFPSQIVSVRDYRNKPSPALNCAVSCTLNGVLLAGTNDAGAPSEAVSDPQQCKILGEATNFFAPFQDAMVRSRNALTRNGDAESHWSGRSLLCVR